MQLASLLYAYATMHGQTHIKFIMSVCPSVRMKSLGSQWTDFRKI